MISGEIFKFEQNKTTTITTTTITTTIGRWFSLHIECLYLSYYICPPLHNHPTSVCRTCSVTVAADAPVWTLQSPVVWSTSGAVMPTHIVQARAVACHRVADGTGCTHIITLTRWKGGSQTVHDNTHHMCTLKHVYNWHVQQTYLLLIQDSSEMLHPPDIWCDSKKSTLS